MYMHTLTPYLFVIVIYLTKPHVIPIYSSIFMVYVHGHKLYGSISPILHVGGVATSGAINPFLDIYVSLTNRFSGNLFSIDMWKNIFYKMSVSSIKKIK